MTSAQLLGSIANNSGQFDLAGRTARSSGVGSIGLFREVVGRERVASKGALGICDLAGSDTVDERLEGSIAIAVPRNCREYREADLLDDVVTKCGPPG